MNMHAEPPRTGTLSAEGQRVADSFSASVAKRQTFEKPYLHHRLEDVFPADIAAELATLPFAPPVLNGVSGKRELHNDQRSYFDSVGVARFPIMGAVAEALQSTRVTQTINEAFAADIDDTFLRLEYAQDVDGFWLQPHTDLGVKKFTCLIYLSDGPGHETLGTDIYERPDKHFGVSPFRRGAAMVFVPGDNTWHGFEKRRIEGVRRSVILNYVTSDWRERAQLSYPERPVRVTRPAA